jgi:hypothetical protein
MVVRMMLAVEVSIEGGMVLEGGNLPRLELH